MNALTPSLVFLAILMLALLAYFARGALLGRFEDEEMDHRGHGALTTRNMRHFFAWCVRPLWSSLARIGFPPDVITLLAIAVALSAGLGVSAGRFALGGWLFLGAGLLDYLDGRVARATGRTTRAGAALDSILDRYADAALLCGLCWYYRATWILLPALLALTGSLFVPYVRARGEALGVTTRDVGIMQRADRVGVLGIGVALSPLVDTLLGSRGHGPSHPLAVVAIVLVAAASHVTTLQRIAAVLRLLGESEQPLIAKRTTKSMLANFSATGVDFVLANFFFHVLRAPAELATAAGCVIGALVSFALLRSWTYEGGAGPVAAQLVRYAVVSAAGAGFNVGGVALLGDVGASFTLAWLLTRSAVFALWSHPAQRDFVFAPEPVGVAQRRSIAGAE